MRNAASQLARQSTVQVKTIKGGPVMKPTTLVSLFAIALLLFSCQARDPIQEATAQFKPILQVYVHACNTGNLDTLNGVLDPQVVRYEGTAVVKSLDALKKLIASERTAFPDFKATIDEEYYFPDHAVLRWTVSGTNTGPGEFPPTGKSFKNTGLSLYRFANGKMAEERAETDGFHVMLQLGFSLAPPGK
jgi:predicted ester cyclase